MPGRTGRARKPTALKLLSGETRPSRINRNEPKPGPVGEVPDWLSVQGRKEWGRLAPMLERTGVLTEADAESLAEMCEAKAAFKLRLLDDGRFPTDLWRAIAAMEARFGLTPSDRSRLTVEPKMPESKLERFRAKD